MVLKMNREIKIFNVERYNEVKNRIPSDFKVVIDGDIILKAFFDKRSKKIGDDNNAHKFKSKPKVVLYFYNREMKTKTNIKNNEKYIFVSDTLKIEIEASKDHDEYFLVSKKIVKNLTSYKD
jgi:hypothetical protein